MTTSIGDTPPSCIEHALAPSKIQVSNKINVFPYSFVHTPSVASPYPTTTTTPIPHNSSVTNTVCTRMIADSWYINDYVILNTPILNKKQQLIPFTYYNLMALAYLLLIPVKYRLPPLVLTHASDILFPHLNQVRFYLLDNYATTVALSV